MIDTPFTKAIVPTVAVVAFLGLGIVGNPGLGVFADAVGGGADADPGDGTPGDETPYGASIDGGDFWATDSEDPAAAESDGRETPENYGEQMADVFSERDTDGSRAGTGEPALSLLSPTSTLRAVWDSPMYLLDDPDSTLARTLQATDDTVTSVGPDDVAGTDAFDSISDDAVDDTTDSVDDTTNAVDDTTDSVDDTTDAVDDTTDDTTDAIDDTTDDTTDAVDNTTDSVDDTTDAIDNTTDSVDDTTDDTTDAIADEETATPTEDDDGLL